nr:glycosyltransferase family protein [Numidum massiliense]
MVDARKILFVTCVNDDELYTMCVQHIRRLRVPEGYTLETLPIRGAKSMAAAYNMALQHNAKYKIYLHQDTFIVNPDFLQDTLAVFQEDDSLGLLGMIGCKVAPPSGTWWEGEKLIGKMIGYHNKTYLLFKFGQIRAPIEAVQSVDGFMMATQYDLPWRDDLFTGFHFYDASQCAEFIKKGYTIGIPKQCEPWCLHVNRDGHTIDETAYNYYRHVYMQHYTQK